MKQHYEVGHYFRKRYIVGEKSPYKLLSESYDHDEVCFVAR